jgi:single-strand DNA-binding protein
VSGGYNRVQLLGNLGADPELRFTQAGGAVLGLRLATTERVKVRDQWEDKTEWHSVTMFGARAEALAKILAKGATVFVEGSLRTSSYEKDGSKRYKTEVIAREVVLAGGRGQGRPTVADEQPRRAPAAPQDAAALFDDGGRDDIPF